MEPKRITTTVVVERWGCWNPAHSHRTLDAAKRCTIGHENAERRRAGKPKDPKHGIGELEWIRFAREQGAPFTAIGMRLGVSRSRAAQLAEKANAAHEKRMRAEMILLPMLMAMCSNAAMNGGR